MQQKQENQILSKYLANKGAKKVQITKKYNLLLHNKRVAVI